MDYQAVLNTLAMLPISEYVRSATWAYPILEIIHVIGLSMLFGGIVLLDLRLIGMHKELPTAHLANYILPFVWAGFALNVISGVLLFLSDATTFGVNLAFQIKMGLIFLAGLNALWFQRSLYPALTNPTQATAQPNAIRLSASLSLVVWVLVITAGRMIAYSPDTGVTDNIDEAQAPAKPVAQHTIQQ